MGKVLINKILFSWFLTTIFIGVHAQVSFQTIVTQDPIVLGESFQVQYVIDEIGRDDEFFAPDFKEFRFISGPNIYSGTATGSSGTKKLKNIVFTLVAIRPGRFIVPGASARVNDKLFKSKDVWITVISKADALKDEKSLSSQVTSDYFLAPGEDPYAKMQRNLFMKVLVDKRVCFVGEPVTAVFKLYSRLESKSDIVKNPGFYGFTVQDMINLGDKVSVVESVNGKKFDVHIVRKVQLYPLQPGIFNIDAMEVQNQVEFSKSIVSKKSEQEIVEGVFKDEDHEQKVNTIVFENNMKTGPVSITVKPTPQKDKPEEYSGATGNFKITTTINDRELAKNEEGDLFVTISGVGNFTQLAAPVIQWPAGIEGFNPTVRDSLNMDHSPLSGKRVFYYRFVSAKPGNYNLPAISFSFFSPDSNQYKTITTEPVSVSVSKKEKIKRGTISGVQKATKKNNVRIIVWMTCLALMIIAMVFYSWARFRKSIKRKPVTGNSKTLIPVSRILQPATTFSDADDITFCTALRNCIWEFFTEYFGLTGSNVNKNSVLATMKQKGVSSENQERIMDLLRRCELGVFTHSESKIDKKEMLKETRELLEDIADG
jgi:hypothetical protein